ncbi:MAG: amino acid permease [Verrucomicrobia bacterium]|nr:amino acid permease [Verrucomicrobiota bacterium]MDE3047383.1 amino acid permease [Verrucomicrobiota bacterium]
MDTNPRKFLNVPLLALLNLSVMTSLRNLPIVSEFGFASSFFYLVVAIVFLFPVSLIAAELATGWTKTGGIYIWVKEAFGPGWGFFAIWMQWIHNVPWFPAILSFSASALAYLINPELANHRMYLLLFTLCGFWAFTFFNTLGLKVSSWFSAFGVICGTIIPGILLIVLGVVWIAQGNPSEIEFSAQALIPDVSNIQNLVFLTGLFLAFGGLEVSAAHAREVQNPQKTFPRSILIASIVALLIYSFGALAIAIMIPKEQISLVSGLMQAFASFLGHFHLNWMMIPLGIMIIYGAIGELNAWVIGPVRSMHATSKHGDLPPIFQKLNKKGAPVNMLVFQAIIVTIASCVFLFMPTASSAFWILSAVAIQIYLVMYILMFAAAIKLRYSHGHVERPYKIPYRKHGIWFVASLGILSSTFALVISFLPPSQLNVGNLFFYEGFLIGSLVIMSIIPYLIYKFRKPSWHPQP